MKWGLFYLELKVCLHFLLNNHLHVDGTIFPPGKKQYFKHYQKKAHKVCKTYTSVLQGKEQEERKQKTVTPFSCILTN